MKIKFPTEKSVEQVPPHAIPAGLLVTVPVPIPALLTVNENEEITRTGIVCEVVVLPAASVTRKVLVVVPNGKLLPLGKPAIWLVLAPEQLSVPTGAV